MSSIQKVIAYHLARLEDKNPDVRIKSIEELRELDDPQILDALRRVYQADDDLRVRKVAQEAGRILYTRLHEQGRI